MSARRSRGPLRSAGVSFMPSGIQTLVRQVLPRALPIAAGDFAAADAVLDPEFADVLVRMGQREAVGGFGMSEVGRVKVQADANGFGPGNPVLELLDAQCVAVDLLAAHLRIAGVEVKAVAAGSQGEGFLEIAAQLLRACGLCRDSCRSPPARRRGPVRRFQIRPRHRLASNGRRWECRPVA